MCCPQDRVSGSTNAELCGNPVTPQDKLAVGAAASRSRKCTGTVSYGGLYRDGSAAARKSELMAISSGWPAAWSSSAQHPRPRRRRIGATTMATLAKPMVPRTLLRALHNKKRAGCWPARCLTPTALLGPDFQPFAISRMRKGLSTSGAMIAAMMLRTAAIIKTAVQLPVAVINTLPSGTRSAAVPLAVYNMP